MTLTTTKTRASRGTKFLFNGMIQPFQGLLSLAYERRYLYVRSYLPLGRVALPTLAAAGLRSRVIPGCLG